MVTLAPPSHQSETTKRTRLSIFGSVRFGVSMLVLLAVLVLVGSWCPQESQVGFEKVVEMFGPESAETLRQLGVTDIFHSPLFLIVVFLAYVNMIAVSFQRVFPRALQLREPLPPLAADAVGKLPLNRRLELSVTGDKALEALSGELSRKGYKTRIEQGRLVAESGKFGRLAAGVTHVGLLTLLTGVTITSWTGFTGFQPVPVGGDLNFLKSDHSKLWVGRLPEWRVRVDGSRREDYETGDPKQWYSDLSVIESNGALALKQQISVNNPLSYKGVDIYQSSWALDAIDGSFNGHKRRLDLRQMGKLSAAFLPLEPGTVLIFSVRDQQKPLRVFGKAPQWESPRLLTEIPLGKSASLGSVNITYEGAVPVTGLQYKCDPGLPVTYVAFAFIIAGVLLAAVPYRQVWAAYEPAGNLKKVHENDAGGDAGCILIVGGRSLKARATFEKGLNQIAGAIETRLGAPA